MSLGKCCRSRPLVCFFEPRRPGLGRVAEVDRNICGLGARLVGGHLHALVTGQGTPKARRKRSDGRGESVTCGQETVATQQMEDGLVPSSDAPTNRRSPQQPPTPADAPASSAQGARRPIPIRLECMAEERQPRGEIHDFRNTAERFGNAHREHVKLRIAGLLPCYNFVAAAGTHVEAAGVWPRE